MRRLTERKGDGIIALGCRSIFPAIKRKGAYLSNAILRLAEYEDTGLTVERAAELGEAGREGRVIILQYSIKPLVWGDDAHETVLCPTCGRDLMGKFDDESAGHPIMYQCCYCGESVDSKTIISREGAEKALEDGVNENL